MNVVKKNIFVLLIIQISNYIFPLLTIPYLARILGPIGIGEIALAQSVIIYLTAVIDFGFNLTVTRKISIANEKKDQSEINRLFTATLYAKILLLILTILLSLILIFSVQHLNSIHSLIFIGYISLVGASLNPIWLFQGLQKMAISLIPTTIFKFLILSLIFIIVKSKDDTFYTMFLMSTGILGSACISLYYTRKYNLAKLIKFNYKDATQIIKESSHIFLSYIGSSIYTTLNTFIMSFFIPIYKIGIYSSADKITSTSQTLLAPIQQAIFPHLSTFKTKLDYINNLKKYGLRFTLFGLSISIALLIFSKLIVTIILGKSFYESYKILMILSALPTIICLGIIFGQWGLIIIDKGKILGRIYLLGGLFHLSYAIFLMMKYGIYGAAISIIITELGITIALAYYFIKSLKSWDIT